MERYLRFIIIGLLFVPRVLSAEARVVKAVRVDEKMSIDGQLKELCWQNTESCSGFIQKYPVEDTVPSELTSVRVMYEIIRISMLVCGRMTASQIRLLAGYQEGTPGQNRIMLWFTLTAIATREPAIHLKPILVGSK